MDWSYEDYLEQWQGWFGDADEGQFEITGDFVQRLTEDEFWAHVEGYDLADQLYDVALKLKDDAAMTAALHASRPHEVALLV